MLKLLIEHVVSVVLLYQVNSVMDVSRTLYHQLQTLTDADNSNVNVSATQATQSNKVSKFTFVITVQLLIRRAFFVCFFVCLPHIDCLFIVFFLSCCCHFIPRLRLVKSLSEQIVSLFL